MDDPLISEQRKRVADAFSRFLEPPRWRWIKHRRWERREQPPDVLRAFAAAVRGEYEPIILFGFATSARRRRLHWRIIRDRARRLRG